MVLYGGMDLHGDNVFCTLLDREYRAVFERRLPNDLSVVLETLGPVPGAAGGLVVESTYNWYWLVDGPASQPVSCAAGESSSDAGEHWPEECERPDGRTFLGQTTGDGRVTGRLHLSAGSTLRAGPAAAAHATGAHAHGRVVELGGPGGTAQRPGSGYAGPERTGSGGTERVVGGGPAGPGGAQISFRHIAFLAREIRQIEQAVEGRVAGTDGYERLLGVPGIGRILAMTIRWRPDRSTVFLDQGTTPRTAGR